MKRALVLSLIYLFGLSLTAFGFFGFGYTHAIPDNDAKLFAGFDFGPDNSQFNIDGYLGDIWGTGGGGNSLMFLGLNAFYIGESEPFDIEVGAYMESTKLVDWPAVTLADAGFYGDMTIHVLDNETLKWDLFASLNLDVTGGNLGLGAEFGFEVNL